MHYRSGKQIRWVNCGRKVKGTIHWVSATQAIEAEIRLYDRLFTVRTEPDATGDFKSFINPNSLEVVNAKCEPVLTNARPEERYQFERLGYFAPDPDPRRTSSFSIAPSRLGTRGRRKRRSSVHQSQLLLASTTTTEAESHRESMPVVFISYSRKDFYFAESLAFHLDREGIPTWLDANHLAPGGDWAAEIDRALDEAQALVLVLTSDSMRSEYVRREWQARSRRATA